MTEAKTEPVCRWCGKTYTQHVYHAPRWALCRTGGTLVFEPEPEAKEVEQDTYGAAMGRRYRLCWEGNARLRAELAVVTAERDAAIADRELSSAAVETAWAEIDAMRPVVDAARSVVAKLLAEIRREGVTAQWAYKREYVALIGAVDALDAAKPAVPLDIAEQEWARLEVDEEVIKESADRMRARMLKWAQDERAAKARLMGDPTLYAKPAEPKQGCAECGNDYAGPGYCTHGAQPTEPKRCTCVEHAEYGAMVDCPVHGVERPERPRGVVQWATDTLGTFICSPRIAAHVAAEIASWDAEPTPLPAWALVDGKHRPHPDCRACDWPASRCGNPNCPALPITASEMHRAFHYVAMRWLQEQGATVT